MVQTQELLLDQFWEARGVFDSSQRKRLVDAAQLLHPGPRDALASNEPLPGVPSTWALEQSAPEVVEVSRRLLALQQLLGGGSGGDADGDSGPQQQPQQQPVDVVWMVVRQPGLLTVDFGQLTSRLLDMKMVTYGMGVDVLRVVEAQPALLLSDTWRLDMDVVVGPGAEAAAPQAAAAATTAAATGREAAVGSAGDAPAASTSQATNSAGPPDEAPSQERALQQLLQAWQHGISSDGDAGWQQRLVQLAAYRTAHGDACVGFREGDDQELARWAAKQRSDHRFGELPQHRLEALEQLGFIFDADEAEWVRWFGELVAFKAVSGHCSPMPLVTGGDLYLIHWAAIQRIARRSRVLADSRIARLDALGFDWTGADPLS